jgi:two-component system nitrogen regulation sensor histidine kinase NtrY
MKERAPQENTTRGIFVLILIFLLLMGVIIVFSRSLVTNIASTNPETNTLAILAAAVLPLILLVVLVFQITRLFRQKAQRRPGASLKMRLTVFFILISLLSAVPQGTLAVFFINSAMGTWFSASIGNTLKGAMSITQEYFNEKLSTLDAFAKSPATAGLISDFLSNPERAWQKIQGLNSIIGAVQVFTGGGAEAVFRGDARARVESFSVIKGTSGDQIETREDVSIIRNVQPLTIGGMRYISVFSVMVSKDLNANARNLTSSLTVFNQLDNYRKLFQLALIAFFFLFSLPIFFITILVSLLLTERIISPIVGLEEATQRVAEGDFSFRILTRPRDEIANLVDSFNAMIARLDQSRKKLMQAERITAWQEIAQRLAHEIRNPLTPIKLSAQRILKKHSDAADDFPKALHGSVSAIIQEVENLERLLREFGEFAKLPNPQPVPADLRTMLAEVASVYNNLSGNVRIDMEQVPQSITLRVDRNQIKRVFANLFKNAMQAMPSGGLLSVRADTLRKGQVPFCRITVSDTGHGIESEDMEKIFDPYFTTKKDGTGLGLAIVQRIVFDHNGNVWAESRKGTGTSFFIDLPMGG